LLNPNRWNPRSATAESKHDQIGGGTALTRHPVRQKRGKLDARKKWRRGESNPGPKRFAALLIHAQSMVCFERQARIDTLPFARVRLCLTRNRRTLLRESPLKMAS
jgi:hypothetical protein